MSCAAGPPTFRLLDARVGWDEATVERLTGLDDPAGVRLAEVVPEAGGIDPGRVWPHLPPPWLAFDCAACEWLLATRSPPPPRLLALGPCACAWSPIGIAGAPPDAMDAVAAHRGLVATADRRAGEVRVWHRDGALEAAFAVAAPAGLAFVSGCELLVAAGGGSGGAPELLRFDPSGRPLGRHRARLPEGAGEPVRLAVAPDGAIWWVTRSTSGALRLSRAACGEESFAPAGLDELAAAFPATGLLAVGRRAFCLRCPGGGEVSCFDRYGRPAAPPADPPAPALERQGQLLTGAVDSGMPRCRWHRVRIEAEVPEGTAVEIAVATSEDPAPDPQGVAAGAWAAFAAGVPHPDDWAAAPGGALDYLIDQPPGRYLFVRLRLTGDGVATPRVRRLRLDFPRVTSLEALPAVYREDARAEDFSERFLALFDAAIEDLDRAIERFPALFDSGGVPEEVLPWLGRFLDVAFDPAWDAERRRAILAGLPALFPLRGTVAGLAGAVELVFGVEPVIEETGLGRPWGAVAARGESSPLAARLGAVRLFGRSRARFRLGRSALSRAAIRSWGDPDLDAVSAGAHRFRVLAPAVGPLAGAAGRTRLERLVAGLKPAHTVAEVAVGAGAAVLDRALRVGIDTRLAAPAPPVLGTGGSVRLGHGSILRGGRRARGARPAVGQTTAVPGGCR